MLFVIFTVLIFAPIIQKEWQNCVYLSKNQGKAMTSNCIFHHYTHAIKRKSILSEPVKYTNFIKFWSLSTFLKIFCVIMERMHTALLLLIMLAAWVNSTCVIVWVATWIWHLFMDHHFCLRELQSKYGYSDLCIWCDRHFHENKWNEPVLSMNNSQWLLPWMKIEISSESYNLEDLYLPLWTWQFQNSWKAFF